MVSSAHHYLEIALGWETKEERKKEKQGIFPTPPKLGIPFPASQARTQRISGFAPYVYILATLSPGWWAL